MFQPAYSTTTGTSVSTLRADLATERALPSVWILLIGLTLISIQIADGVLTAMGMYRYGHAMEGNPLLRMLMIQFGTFPTLALAELCAVGIIILLCLLSTRIKWIGAALALVGCVYMTAAIIPWTLILFS